MSSFLVEDLFFKQHHACEVRLTINDGDLIRHCSGKDSNKAKPVFIESN